MSIGWFGTRFLPCKPMNIWWGQQTVRTEQLWYHSEKIWPEKLMRQRQVLEKQRHHDNSRLIKKKEKKKNNRLCFRLSDGHKTDKGNKWITSCKQLIGDWALRWLRWQYCWTIFVEVWQWHLAFVYPEHRMSSISQRLCNIHSFNKLVARQ